jgi:hypothetical protein
MQVIVCFKDKTVLGYFSLKIFTTLVHITDFDFLFSIKANFHNRTCLLYGYGDLQCVVTVYFHFVYFYIL